MVKVKTVPPPPALPLWFTSHSCPGSSTACHYTLKVTARYHQPEQRNRLEQSMTERKINLHVMETERAASTLTHPKKGARLHLSSPNNYKPASVA